MTLTLYQHHKLERSNDQYTTEQIWLNGNPDSNPASAPSEFQWFPEVSGWDVEELQRLNGSMTFKPASKWSVDRISRLYGVLENFLMEKQRHRVNYRYEFDKLPMNVLINCANKTLGFSSWSNEIVNGTEKLTKYDKEEFNDGRPNKYSMIFELDVKLKLKDGTTLTRRGTGKADQMPSKNAAFVKSRKTASTDGLKKCFYGLIEMLTEYEEKVRAGFFERYRD